MAIARIGYKFYKNDPDFRSRPDEYFEGAMKLTVLGLTIEDLTGYKYRVTAEDVNGDGSVIRRYTWDKQDAFTPAPKSNAMKDFEYDLVRVMDETGKINGKALGELRSIIGNDVVMLAPEMPASVQEVLVPIVIFCNIVYTFMLKPVLSTLPM